MGLSGEFDPNNPYTQIMLLAQRVDNLCQEKEALEEQGRDVQKRLTLLEKQANNAMGGFMMLAILGSAFTFAVAFWDRIKGLLK